MSPISEHVCRAECKDPNRQVHFGEERAPPRGAQKQLRDHLDHPHLKSQSPKLGDCISALLWNIKEFFFFFLMHYQYMRLINLYLQSWILNAWSRAHTVGYSEKSTCIRGGYRLRSTYSCLAVMEMADPWLCLVSSLCCSRWSRIDCGANGALRGALANAPWLEGMVLLFSCSDLCPL